MLANAYFLHFFFFFLCESSCTEWLGTAWGMTQQQSCFNSREFPAFSYLTREGRCCGELVVSMAMFRLDASGVPLRQVTAPKVIPSLFPHTTALAWWSGYSWQAQKKWCVWFCFSQCLLSDSHLHYRIPVCTSVVPIPLIEPLAFQRFIQDFLLSAAPYCCMFSKNTFWVASESFCPGCNQSLWGPTEWESLFLQLGPSPQLS